MNISYRMQVAAALVIAGALTAGMYLAGSGTTAACDPARDILFARQYRAPGGPVQEVALFKFDPTANKGDVELGTIHGYSVNGYYHDRKGRIFFFPSDGPQHSLYVYTICDGKLRKAIDLPETDRSVTSARHVGDSDTLLVATRDGGPVSSATNSRLEVYEQGRRVSIADVSIASALYAFVAIIGVTPDGSTAYLSEAGVDGGDEWGAYYRWDRTTNSVQKLGDFEISENGSSGYLLDGLNPSATFAMRVRQADYAASDLESSQSVTPGCIKTAVSDSGKYDNAGDELLVRDLSTGEERVVYRNLMGGRNYCQNHLRVIASPRWYDERTIVFSTPLGVYSADAQSGMTRLIASQDVELWGGGMRSSMRLVGVNDEYLFTRRSSVIHIKTGKEVSVPALRSDREAKNLSTSTQFVVPVWTAGSD